MWCNPSRNGRYVIHKSPTFPTAKVNRIGLELVNVIDLRILVKGHAGKLLFGLLQGHQKAVILMLGRPQ